MHKEYLAAVAADDAALVYSVNSCLRCYYVTGGDTEEDEKGRHRRRVDGCIERLYSSFP